MSGSNQETPGPRDDRPRLCLFRPRGHTLRPTAGCDSSATPRLTVPGPRRASAEKSGSSHLRGQGRPPRTSSAEPLSLHASIHDYKSRHLSNTRGDPYLRGPARPQTRVYPVPPETWSQLRRTSPRALSSKEWAATQQLESVIGRYNLGHDLSGLSLGIKTTFMCKKDLGM